MSQVNTEKHKLIKNLCIPLSKGDIINGLWGFSGDDLWIILEQLTVICQGRFDRLGLVVRFLYKVGAGHHVGEVVLLFQVTVVVGSLQHQRPVVTRMSLEKPDELVLQFFNTLPGYFTVRQETSGKDLSIVLYTLKEILTQNICCYLLLCLYQEGFKLFQYHHGFGSEHSILIQVTL